MGGSHWSDEAYRSNVTHSVTTRGTAFHYDADYKSGRASTVSPKLDPVAMKADPASGIKRRESRDSDAHPRSRAITIGLDVTGSMASVVRTIHAKLPALMGLLTRKAYVEDPQILFAAVGDATCDSIPLQVGQFESGAEMESDLAHFVLEGGGGGQMTESYELLMYFAARHTSLDCHEKRGERGYMFFIGDEMPYPLVSREQVKRLIGADLQADIPITEIAEELKQKYNVFFIMPKDADHGRDPRVPSRWREVLGTEQVLELPQADAVAELIALQIGLCEGTTDVDAGAKDMEAAGSSTALVRAAAAGVSRAHAGAAVAKVAPGALKSSSGPGVERL